MDDTGVIGQVAPHNSSLIGNSGTDVSSQAYFSGTPVIDLYFSSGEMIADDTGNILKISDPACVVEDPGDLKGRNTQVIEKRIKILEAKYD